MSTIEKQGDHLRAVIDNAEHHGQKALPILRELALGVMFILTKDVTIRHAREGANSYSIHFEDGRKLYFRGYPPYDEVMVLDSAWRKHANVVATLRSPEDARAFIESL